MKDLKTILVVTDSHHTSGVGTRVVEYLKGYADKKDLDLDVVAYSVDKAAKVSADDIQRAVWSTYVGTNDGRSSLIINTVEMGELYRCEADQEAAFKINAVLPSYLAMAARTAGIPLIHLSTDLVFGGQAAANNAKPDDKPNPTTTYGITKLSGEETVSTIHPYSYEEGVLSGTIIVRVPSMQYGLGMPGPVAEAMVPNKKRLKVVTPHRGKGYPTFVGDVAWLITRNLLEDPASYYHPIIHVGTAGEPMTWEDFLQGRDEIKTKATISSPEVGRVRDPYPPRVGLEPTVDWFTCSDPAVQWANYQREVSHGSLQYW